MSDLSEEALQLFIRDAGLSESLGSEAFYRRLMQQGLIEDQNGKLIPTGYGVLLFATATAVITASGITSHITIPKWHHRKEGF